MQWRCPPLQRWQLLLPLPVRDLLTHRRTLSTVSDNVAHTEQSAKQKDPSGPSVSKREPRSSRSATIAQRDFFFDVLNVNATKRDAKQYLSRFDESDNPQVTSAGDGAAPLVDASKTAPTPPPRNALRQLYGPTRAIGSAPQFRADANEIHAVTDGSKIFHVALISLNAVNEVDDPSLDAIATTLSQLVRLEMRIVLTFDVSITYPSIAEYQTAIRYQSERLTRSLNRCHAPGARYVDAALSIARDEGHGDKESLHVRVENVNLMLQPLRQTIIPLIPSVAYDTAYRAVRVDPREILIGLTRSTRSSDDLSASQDVSMQDLIVDRIIVIDGIGGIPSLRRDDGSHVFVNLSEEYDEIASELRNEQSPIVNSERHLWNLQTVRECLSLVSDTSSALIISPEEASASSRPSLDNDSGPPNIRTRRQKNPLIHNLLTNRPIVSSSLPSARVAASESSIWSRSTLVKLGMPLAITPSVRQGAWKAPPSGASTLDLRDDPSIDFPRLLNLVEDSFRRRLDVEGYIERVSGDVAGVIVAGDYEGGAILTWERPPGADATDPTRLVPYLDKFAVLQKSQGNAGVADIVFQAMTRSCLPSGVCWRSRSNNPVNKWYFERSVGTWKLPGGQWTMFWTTPNEALVLDERKWADYVAVCEGVVPTWADRTRS